MSVAAIVLAAGRSTRFADGAKLTAEIDGLPLIRRVLKAVAAAPVDDIVLVIAPGGEDVRAAAGEGRWRSIVNANAALGLSSSIKTGLAALPDRTEGALIVLGDMPFVSSDTLARLRAAFEAHKRAGIVVPRTPDGRQGNPVLWPRALFAELMALSGDAGGKELLARHARSCHDVPISAAECLTDIDTREDLARVRGPGAA